MTHAPHPPRSAAFRLQRDPRSASPSPHHPVHAPAPDISTRQLQVWTRIASSEPVKSIGPALGISPKTVEYHRAELFRKFGIHDIASLTRAAIRCGLVTD